MVLTTSRAGKNSRQTVVEGRTGKDQVVMAAYRFRVQSRVRYIGLYFSSHIVLCNMRTSWSRPHARSEKMLCVQDIIEKQEFSGSIDNNDNNDVVCLRLPVLSSTVQKEEKGGAPLLCHNTVQKVTGVLCGVPICCSKIVLK